MAIYHLHAQIIGRSAGRSAVAAAAYRATERLYDRTTGETFDFSRKSKALYSGVLLPRNAPEWAKDRGELWNRVEEKEKRKDAQFCREFDVALPEELKNYPTLYQSMVAEFCIKNFTDFGLAVDYAIHKPDKKGDERNYHAHILVTMRKFENGEWAEKKDRGSNTPEALQDIRESWEYHINKSIAYTGQKVSCRSLKEQGITDREPQQHQGVTATAMERKGREPRRKRYRQDQITPEQIARELVRETTWHKEPPPMTPEREAALKAQQEAEAEAMRRLKIIQEDQKEFWREFGPYRAGAFTEKQRKMLDENPSSVKMGPEAVSRTEAPADNLEAQYQAWLKAEHEKTAARRAAPIAAAATAPLKKPHPVFDEKFTEAAAEKSIEYEKSRAICRAVFISLDEIKNRNRDTETDRTARKLRKRPYNEEPETRKKLWGLYRQQEKKQPELYAKIQKNAEELLDKISDFEKYRTIKTALDEVKAAREESRKREQAAQQQQQSRGRSR